MPGNRLKGKEMAKFTVNGLVTVSCYTEVEADTKEEALEIASERELSGLCYSPFTSNGSESFHFQNDGMPFDLKISGEQ